MSNIKLSLRCEYLTDCLLKQMKRMSSTEYIYWFDCLTLTSNDSKIFIARYKLRVADHLFVGYEINKKDVHVFKKIKVLFLLRNEITQYVLIQPFLWNQTNFVSF